MDVKKLGRIPDGGGWRVHGRADATGTGTSTASATTTSTPWSTTTPGWPTPRSCPTRRARPAPRSSTRAIAYFAAHGITQIERLITDNAWAYRLLAPRRLRRARRSGRSSSSRTAPGRTARSNASTAPSPTEWAYRQAFTTNQARRDALAPWLEHYNTQRRHSHSEANPRSADCHQPDGRVHLDRLLKTPVTAHSARSAPPQHVFITRPFGLSRGSASLHIAREHRLEDFSHGCGLLLHDDAYERRAGQLAEPNELA